MITLEEFKGRVTVIEGSEADRLRQKYIDRFVDVDTPYYREKIASRKPYSDGLYYSGYLWDCLKQPAIITEQQFQASVARYAEVFVFWDLHSSEKIWTADYWKFPRNAVLLSKAGDALLGLDYLPDDIYVFDDSLDWSVVRTYTIFEDGTRICYRVS